MENQELQTTRNQSIVTIGDWIITMILMCIPFVNFIMLLVWAFSAGTPVSLIIPIPVMPFCCCQ